MIPRTPLIEGYVGVNRMGRRRGALPNVKSPNVYPKGKTTTHRSTSAGPAGAAGVLRCANAAATAPTTAKAGDESGGTHVSGPPHSGGTHASEASDGDSRGDSRRRRQPTAAAKATTRAAHRAAEARTRARRAAANAEATADDGGSRRQRSPSPGTRYSTDTYASAMEHARIVSSAEAGTATRPSCRSPDSPITVGRATSQPAQQAKTGVPSLIRQTRTHPPWSTHASSHRRSGRSASAGLEAPGQKTRMARQREKLSTAKDSPSFLRETLVENWNSVTESVSS